MPVTDSNPYRENYIVSTRIYSFETLSDIMIVVNEKCHDCFQDFSLKLGASIGYCDYYVTGIGIQAYENAHKIFKTMHEARSGINNHNCHIFRIRNSNNEGSIRMPEL